MTTPATVPSPSQSDGPPDERFQAVVTDDRPPDSVPSVDLDDLARLAEAALDASGATPPAELAVTLVDVPTITRLNEEHLGGTGPTDVLSFPLEAPGASEVADPVPAGAPRLLGDVVVCVDVAAANAPDHAGTFTDELALLCVHGVLHVLGWDHATVDDAVAMRAEEARILALVHRPVPAGTEIPS